MKTRRWDFVSAHAGTFGVQRICQVLQVSRSGYYRWLAGAKARAESQAAKDAHRGLPGVRGLFGTRARLALADRRRRASR